MSKAKVEQALRLAAAGDATAGARLLANVAPQFVDKRLALLAREADLRDAVAALRSALDRALPMTVAALQSDPRPATSPPPRSVSLPAKMTLQEASLTLRALSTPAPCEFRFDQNQVAQMWALVGLAARARDSGPERAFLAEIPRSTSGRFAHAVGLEDAVDGLTAGAPPEAGRTVKLQRVTDITRLEEQSRTIASLMLPGTADEEVRKTIKYVLLELFRNVLQHSRDRLGGIVGAQLQDQRAGYSREVVQVAVADSGIGILEALRVSHPKLVEPRAALSKALEPHISGTFVEGRTGSLYNAGMGLFFVAEMAKLTGGRLMIATRGAALSLQGDPDFNQNHDVRFVHPEGIGFPGTLVAFELPLGNVEDLDAMLAVIRDRAEERTPARNTIKVLRYEEPPADVIVRLVSLVAENAVAAEALAREQLTPLILAGKAVALDFRTLDICTQSFLHALLFQPLRFSWALNVPIYVINAGPAVRTGLGLVESYALGG